MTYFSSLVYSYLVYNYFLNNLINACKSTQNKTKIKILIIIYAIILFPTTSLLFHPPGSPLFDVRVFLSLLYFFSFFSFLILVCKIGHNVLCNVGGQTFST